MNKCIHTESKSIGTVRRQDESNNSDQGHQTIRYNQIYDVVQRSASYLKRKGHASKHGNFFDRCSISCKQNNVVELTRISKFSVVYGFLHQKVCLYAVCPFIFWTWVFWTFPCF